MKISTDIDRLTPGANTQYSKVNAKKVVPDIDEGIQANAQNLVRTKGMVDALIIAQMARSFMQKAELITSRLRSVAMETMISGKINEGEFKEALTGISSSLNEVNESFAPAIVYSGAGGINPDAAIVDFSEMKRNVDRLKTITSDLMEGKIPDMKEFDVIAVSFNRKASAINDTFIQIKKSINPDMPGDFEYYPDLHSFVSDLGKQISGTPDAAFLSQGNLNYERVNGLYLEGKL